MDGRKGLWTNILATILVTAFGALPALAAREAPPGTALTHPVVGHAVGFRVSPPLRDLKLPVETNLIPKKNRELPAPVPRPTGKKGFVESGPVDPAVQTMAPVMSMPAPLVQWEGVGNINGVAPPDTNGDVGPNHYVQWVNLSFAVWDKSGNLLYGPVNGNTLWSAMGAPCGTSNDGDIIVLYDRMADRWFMSQFALPNLPNDPPNGPGPFYQAIAVSQTPDPLGAWYLYCFQVHATKMNDYPKFGVWPDGYYMSVNQYTSSFAGAGVFVFDRAKMLAGDPSATFQYFDLAGVSMDYFGLLPSHFEGLTPPPPGAPNVFVDLQDDAWGFPTDRLQLWEFHVDWATPANTTFGLGGAPNVELDTAPFDTNMCGYSRNCIPQPGTGHALDALSDRLMYRLQYRNNGGSQSLVVNHTVDADGTDHAGVRWYELRNPGSGWTIAQQGTFAPDASDRWMGSAAMDHMGDIAVGYSVSDGSSTYPSVRYAGRLPWDPSGQLGQGEATMIAGGGSETAVNRWGDYSSMSVDPTDDCTFWYTQEYIATTGSWAWQTRIGSFKFPSCTMGPTGTLSGTVTDTGATPIGGATVSATAGATTIQTTTQPDGTYAMTLPVDTWSVTASAFGYAPLTVGGVAVTDGGTTTQDFQLTQVPSHTISGTVTDANTGWPLYADVGIATAGYSATIQTDPVTGAYSATLPDGMTYSMTANAHVAGYLPGAATVGPLAGDTVQNFPLGLDGCVAPGYQQSVVISENFNGAFPPAGWTVTDADGGGLVWSNVAGSGESGNWAGTGDAASVSSDAFGYSSYDTYLVTPVFDVSALTTVTLDARVNFQNFAGYDYFQIDVSNDGGGTWTNVLNWNEDHGGFRVPNSGEDVSLDVSAQLAGSSTAMARFRYYYPNVDWFWYAQVDDVVIAPSCVTPPGGLIVGTVTDFFTGLPLSGAQVTNATNGQTTTTDPAGFYTLYGDPGVNSVSAFKPTYSPVAATPTVAPGGTVRQDFALTPAPQVQVTGQVTDAFTGWPLYAKVHVTAAGLPDVDAWTDPVTGMYSVSAWTYVPYTFTAYSWVPGYDPVSSPVGPLTSPAVQDFALWPNYACTAPGYQLTGGVAESFDGTTLPAGWSVVQNAGCSWAFDNPGGRTNNTGGSGNFAIADSDFCGLTTMDTELRTPVMDFTTYPSVILQFNTDFFDCCGAWADVDVSVNGAAGPWINVWGKTSDYEGPHTEVVDISTQAAGQPNVMARFHYNGWWDWWWEVDDVIIDPPPTCTPPATGGLVVGNAYDGNTASPVSGATVTHTASGATAATVDTPEDPAIPDGFYCLYSNTEGPSPVTATKTGYGTDNRNPAVPHLGAVRQDFSLPAGLLQASPAAMAATLPQCATATQTLTLTNAGTLPVAFSIGEAYGHAAPAHVKAQAPKPDSVEARGRERGPATGERLAAKMARDEAGLTPGDTKKREKPHREKPSIGRAPLTNRPPREDAAEPFPILNPGEQAYAMDLIAENLVTFDNAAPGTFTTVAGEPGSFFSAGDFTPGDFSVLHVIDHDTNQLIDLDTATGAPTLIGPCTPSLGQSWSGMTIGGGTAYACSTDISTSILYTVDLNTGAATPIGPITGAPGIIDIAVDWAGNMYGVDIVLDSLVAIDPVTGAGTVVGPLGFNANYAQGMDFDDTTGVLYLAAFNRGIFQGELRTADTTTGATTLVGVFPGGTEVDALAFVTSCEVPWLSENPVSGTVNPGQSVQVDVTYDPTGMEPGAYAATLRVDNDAPYGLLGVPVDMTVTPFFAALATAAPDHGVPPLVVAFTGMGYGGHCGPYTYDWDFGDGSPHSSAQNPTHTYTANGTYPVTFTVTDPVDGATVSDTHIVILVGAFYEVHAFMDDMNSSQLCVDAWTGDYTWNILSGPWAGGSFAGTAMVMNGLTQFWSVPGDPNYMYCTYDPINHTAWGFFFSYQTYAYGSLWDMDTTDDPPCGGGQPVRAEPGDLVRGKTGSK